MIDFNRISALLAERKEGHALPQGLYNDAQTFEFDMQAIYGRSWLMIGFECELPRHGSYLAEMIGNWPILIVRGRDGEIRAFHNSCRHRGSLLCQPGSGTAPRIVCPYHNWTYGLDGALMVATRMAEDFDKSEHGLKQLHLKRCAGAMFVCFAANPPPFEDFAEKFAAYLGPQRMEDAKLAHTSVLSERANWKLVMENGRECYHCAANHPELTIPLFAYGFGFSPATLDEDELEQARRYQALVEASHQRWTAAGTPSREVEHLADRVTGFRTERLPLDQAGESQTMDARVACRRLMGRLTDTRLGGLSFWTQPNSWHHFMSDHAITFAALPLSPDKTLLRTTWLVHKDAVEGVDYDVDNLTSVWDATNRQDAALVEITQAGVRSPAYEPGPYSPHTEGLVEQFCEWYIERMRAGLG